MFQTGYLAGPSHPADRRDRARMAFVEGSANDWLALAMVDGHGVDNATGALVFGVFVTAMTGRGR